MGAKVIFLTPSCIIIPLHVVILGAVESYDAAGPGGDAAAGDSPVASRTRSGDEYEPDPRYNNREAFGEWFNEEVRSLDDVEEEGEHFDTVMEEWCCNNNHEIREDGVYNMNILAPSSGAAGAGD